MMGLSKTMVENRASDGDFCSTFLFLAMEVWISTQLWYIHVWTGRRVFNYLFGLAGVLSSSGTEHSCANLKCEISDVNKPIPLNFMGANSVLWNMIHIIRGIIQWYIHSDTMYNIYLGSVYSVHSYLQKFASSRHIRWITVDRVWHWSERRLAIDWC